MRSHSRCAVLLFFGCCFAQTGGTTWQGLRFGMSVDNAKLALIKAFELQANTTTKDSYLLKPDYELKVGSAKISFSPDLRFDSNSLSMITLSADIPKTIADTPGLFGDRSLMSMGIAASFFERGIYEQLEGKYGRPLKAEGQCGDVPVDMLIPSSREILSCSASWKEEGQTISFYWDYTNLRPGTFHLFVTYRAIPSGL